VAICRGGRGNIIIIHKFHRDASLEQNFRAGVTASEQEMVDTARLSEQWVAALSQAATSCRLRRVKYTALSGNAVQGPTLDTFIVSPVPRLCRVRTICTIPILAEDRSRKRGVRGQLTSFFQWGEGMF